MRNHGAQVTDNRCFPVAPQCLVQLILNTLQIECFPELLANIAHVLNPRHCNVCCNLTRATAESNATNAMLEESSAAGPGLWETSELEHGPLLTLPRDPPSELVICADDSCYRILLPGPWANCGHETKPLN